MAGAAEVVAFTVGVAWLGMAVTGVAFTAAECAGVEGVATGPEVTGTVVTGAAGAVGGCVGAVADLGMAVA